MFSQTLDSDKGYDNSRNDNYGNTTAAYADAEPVGVSNNGESNPFLVKKQPTRCRDPLFAVLLLVNVAAIVGVTIRYSGDVIKSFTDADANANADADADADAEKIDYTGIIYTAIATAAIASGLSAVTMQVMICIPGILIKAALFFNIGLSLVMAALGFMYGGIIAGIIGIVFFALMLCYARAVWSRIPFATANLKTGCAAIRANCGVTIISYIITAVAFAWSVLWSLCVAGVQDKLYKCDEDGVCSNPNYGLLFLLFLSFFFTHQVLQNCVHVTVAGVTGTWWFNPQESGFCSGAVFGALGRTFTTSFGSICFGSLLVAIIQATRQLAESARQNDDVGQLLACCVDCILSCLESILEYFNKWAFVYVGLYGYGYCEAGKNVIQLFKDRGWEAIIADDLVGMVLFMVSLIVGLITGALAMSFVSITDWFDDWPYDGAEWVAFAVGLVVGLVLCSILMSVIASSVNATIVLFAEGPAEFEKNHPELSAEMREAWQSAHPGCF